MRLHAVVRSHARGCAATLCLWSLATGCMAFQDASLGVQERGDAAEAPDAATSEERSDAGVDTSMQSDAGTTRPERDAGTHRDGSTWDGSKDASHDDDDNHDAGKDGGSVSVHCMLEPWECP